MTVVVMIDDVSNGGEVGEERFQVGRRKREMSVLMGGYLPDWYLPICFLLRTPHSALAFADQSTHLSLYKVQSTMCRLHQES